MGRGLTLPGPSHPHPSSTLFMSLTHSGKQKAPQLLCFCVQLKHVYIQRDGYIYALKVVSLNTAMLFSLYVCVCVCIYIYIYRHICVYTHMHTNGSIAGGFLKAKYFLSIHKSSLLVL